VTVAVEDLKKSRCWPPSRGRDGQARAALSGGLTRGVDQTDRDWIAARSCELTHRWPFRAISRGVSNDEWTGEGAPLGMGRGVTHEVVMPHLRRRTIGVALLLALIPAAVAIPALATLAVVSVVCSLVVAYEAIRHREPRVQLRHPESTTR
jgi:hypothetical protein